MSRTKQRDGRSVGLALCFLVFLLIFDYPFLARLYTRGRQAVVVTKYKEALDSVLWEERNELLLKAREYNRKLALGEEEEISFSDFQTEADGAIAHLEIPKIGADMLVYPENEADALQKGAEHLKGSSLPVGGKDTHACISAHRGLPDKKLFTSLDELEAGDLFFVSMLGERLCYRVSEIRTVLPFETEELSIQKGEDLVTLITCTPYGINTHRLCVEGSRVPCTKKEETEADAQKREGAFFLFLQDWAWLLFSILLLLLLCCSLIRRDREKDRKK